MEIEMLGRITQFPVRTETCFFNAINRFHSDPSYYPIPRKD